MKPTLTWLIEELRALADYLEQSEAWERPVIVLHASISEIREAADLLQGNGVALTSISHPDGLLDKIAGEILRPGSKMNKLIRP